MDSLLSLPIEILVMILDWARWLPVREVCQEIRAVIPNSVVLKWTEHTISTGSWENILYLADRVHLTSNSQFGTVTTSTGGFYTRTPLHVVAARGDVSMFRIAVVIFQYPVDWTCSTEAAASGHKDLLRHLFIEYAVLPAVSDIPDGRYDLIEWWTRVSDCHSVHLLQYVGGSGKIKNMKWLLDRGFNARGRAMYIAAKQGNDSVLSSLLQMGCKWNNDHLVIAKTDYAFRFFLSLGAKWSERSMKRAIRNCPEWVGATAIGRGCPLSAELTKTAAKYERLETLDLLLDMRCPVHPRTLEYLSECDPEHGYHALRLYHRITNVPSLAYSPETSDEETASEED